MAFTDLIPWRRGSQAPARTSSENLFSALQREMNALFDDFFRSWGSATLPMPRMTFSPSITVHESAKEYRVSAELPGLTEKDIKVELSGNALTISGEKKEEHEEKRGTTVYSERSYGSFYRSIPLPEAVDRNKVKAQFKNGVLTVTLPKTAQAKAAHKQIPVKAE
ncbi:MAG: Hsp20/alpha crystallin family protein [bacterium]|nr:Hsp20/alpha crystallin family protein [bacterium]